MEEEIANDMQEILRQAGEQDGRAWEMVLGELQLQFGEACLWVLLDQPTQAPEALRILSDIVAPYIQKWSGVKFTVSFNAIEGDEEIFIDHLEGAEITDGSRLLSIGAKGDRDPLSPTDIFLSERRRRLAET